MLFRSVWCRLEPFGAVWCSLVQFRADWCSLVQFGAILVQFVAVWCSLVQIGAVRCRLVQIGAVRCRLVQFGADWSSSVQFGAVWRSLVQFGAVWCSWCRLVQVGAVWCSLVQIGAVRCRLVQFGAVWSRLVQFGAVWPEADPVEAVRGRLEALGFLLADDETQGPLLQLETEGRVLRAQCQSQELWVDRPVLMRIHQRMKTNRRARFNPVSPATFLRFLAAWQHVDPEYQVEGPRGVAQVLRQLAGCEAPAPELGRLGRPLRSARPPLRLEATARRPAGRAVL